MGKDCVISLLDPNERAGVMIREVYNKASEVDLFDRPELSKIKKCFNGDYDSVTWVSHGSLMGMLEPYYAPIHRSAKGEKMPLYQRYFKRLASTIKISKGFQFRVAFCGSISANYKNTMSPLMEAIKEQGGRLDILEKSKLASYIIGSDVVSLSKSWLAKSIDKEVIENARVWKTERNRWCESDYWPGCNRERAKYVIPTE